MAVQLLGGQRPIHPKHQFRVEISGQEVAGFQKCSELSAELAKIEYWEGGNLIPWKCPGRMTFTDITLETGACNDRQFYQWLVDTGNAAVGGYPRRGSGLSTPDYMRNLEVIQLDRDALTPLKRWFVRNAWIQKYSGGDWDATTDEAVVEMLTLTFDFFQLLAA